MLAELLRARGARALAGLCVAAAVAQAAFAQGAAPAASWDQVVAKARGRIKETTERPS